MPAPDQPLLFALPTPPPVPGIDLRCCGVEQLLDTVPDDSCQLVHADPPWGDYDQRPGQAAPDLTYPVLTTAEIAGHLRLAYRVAAPGGRLVLWWCWPLLAEALGSKGIHPLLQLGRWRWMTGGSWTKGGGHQGVGYHWLGRSEPVLVLVKPGGTPYVGTDKQGTRYDLGNAHVSVPTGHSEKPVGWQVAMLRRWVPPDGQVLDLYAGWAPMARAARGMGVRYLGAEIDPTRHSEALTRLACLPVDSAVDYNRSTP